MLRLVLRGENLVTGLGWLDLVMAAFECRSLLEGVAFKELRRLCGVMRLVQI